MMVMSREDKRRRISHFQQLLCSRPPLWINDKNILQEAMETSSPAIFTLHATTSRYHITHNYLRCFSHCLSWPFHSKTSSHM